MNRTKKLTVLLGVLIFACIATFGVSRYEGKKEQIKTSGETVFSLETEDINAISWTLDGNTLSFTKDDSWLWDDDENFPVDTDKMENILKIFNDIKADFIIEQPEDTAQYGLDNPECTITLSTREEEYSFSVGDLSEMDSQRYFSMGDGNVYLITTDPTDTLDIDFDDVMLHDHIPDMDTVTELAFAGLENYTITYDTDSVDAYSPADVYFADVASVYNVVDEDSLESYIRSIESLNLINYHSYNATQDQLAETGLDNPQLAVTVKYVGEDNETSEFVMYISRDPEELAEESRQDEEDESITAYFQIKDSQIIYKLSSDDYITLTTASYNDMRSENLFPSDFDDVTAMDITLEGITYSITSQLNDDDKKVFCLGEEEISVTNFTGRLNALDSTEYTDITPTGKEEISVKFYVDNPNHPEITVTIYRQDGESCVGTVNGNTVSLIDRSDVVDFIESVNSIVLK